MAVGAALALREQADRLPVAVLGDGDYLMGLTAIWTGVHYRVPVLVIVANNESFFNDELHQERDGAGARPAGRESLDRHAHERSAAGPRHARAKARARSGSVPSTASDELLRRCSHRRSTQVQAGGACRHRRRTSQPEYARAVSSSLLRQIPRMSAPERSQVP